MGERAVWLALVVGICAAALVTVPAVAGATIHYVSPTGDSKASCSSSSPCKIETALEKAKDGDAVSLEGGEYELPFGGIRIQKDIDFGAVRGEPATLETSENDEVQIDPKTDATLHDLRIEGGGSVLLYDGRAERLFATTTNPLRSACFMGPGALLRDSVCWARPDESEIEDEPSHGIRVDAGGFEAPEPVVIRNVTAWTTSAVGSGINAQASAGAQLTVDAKNVIAHSDHGIDIVAERTKGGTPKVLVNISNSNFATYHDDPSEATVTLPGTAGNVAAAPSLVSPAEGDLHQNDGSPTLDGGVADSFVGQFDLDGAGRAHSKCLGAAAVPDMGAYERAPTAQCPPPPPEPPKPPETTKPIFRIVSLSLNRKTGGGRLLVEVPGVGTLSLAGSGVKLVRRTAPAEGGVISLPIQLWVITRVRLAKVGKTKVRLNVTFDGRSGGFEEWSKGVVLRKKKQ